MSQQALFARPDLKILCEESGEMIAKAKERFKPVATFALFSGGDDSTAMVHLVAGQIDAAVHINTGIGIQQTTVFVHQTCERMGIPIIELRTQPSVYQNIVLGPKAQGFPGPAFHYRCYHQLKNHRLRDLQRNHSSRGQRILLLSGIRRSESVRRMVGVGRLPIKPPSDPSRCAWANPIIDFDKAHLAVYRAENGVPRSEVAARFGRSGECLCGAFARCDELEQIERLYPETGEYIRSLEKEADRQGKRFPAWGWGQGERGPSPGPLCDGCAMKTQDESLFAAPPRQPGASHE